MPHSFSSIPPFLGYYAPSASSSARSSRSSTGNHSPPPLWSATDKLMLRIKHFLDNDFYGSNDLVLSVTPVEFDAFWCELKRPSILPRAQLPHIRYTWNRKTHILTISCMPGSVHDALIPCLVSFWGEMGSHHPTTVAERRSIVFSSGTAVVLLPNPETSIIAGRGKHATGVSKEPDGAFKFFDRRTPIGDACPRVVFEVAFSQTYESVLEDARQWLVRTHGNVKLCVIVKIYEQPNSYKQLDYTEITPKLAEQRRIQESDPDQQLSVTEQPEAPTPEASATDVSSSALSHDDRMDTMDGRALFLSSLDEHAAWVGPLTGFIELYRLSDDATSIKRDGPRYDIFDPTGPDPLIGISDLLPPHAIEGDPSRAYPLVLADYRQFLEQGVRELALLRKVHAEKMKAEAARGKEEDDADYEEDGGDGGDGEAEDA